MKKGFTLVELLSVIIIIGVVALIVFPTVMNSIKKSKQNAYDIQIRDIEEVGRKWATEHMEYLDHTHLNSIGIPLSSFVTAGYIQNSSVIDPRDKSQMNGCILITYEDISNQYRYQYIESNCENILEHGYIYRYSNTGWVKEEQDVIKSASDTIIDYYADNRLIKTEGQTTDGFYDEGERYVFRGVNVDNYVKLNGGSEIYRILNIDKSTGKIRLMGTTAVPNAWDNNNGVIFENASITTAQLETYYNSSTNGIIENESKIETNAIWNAGTTISNVSYSVLKSLETGRTAYGKIGLPSISDYVGSSTNLACHEAVLSDSCKQQNYLYEIWKEKNTWMMNTEESKVWYVNIDGVLDKADANSIFYIYPVIEMKNNVSIIRGDGKAISPYIMK